MSSIYHNPLNARLNSQQQQENAIYIRDYLLPKGWTLNAICGMLGNLQSESLLNPNLYEDFKLHSSELGKYGYGLAQWTPWLGRIGDTIETQRNYHGTKSPTYGPQSCPL